MEHSRQTMAELGKPRREGNPEQSAEEDTQMNGHGLGEEARMIQASSSIHRQETGWSLLAYAGECCRNLCLR